MRSGQEDQEPGDDARCGKVKHAKRKERRRTVLAVRVSACAEVTGVRQGTGSPCVFFHVERDVRKVVPGDDYEIVGPRSGVVYKEQGLGARHTTKNQLDGPLKGDVRELTLLSISVNWHHLHHTTINASSA